MRRTPYIYMLMMVSLAALLSLASCRREPLHEPYSSYYLDLDISLEALHKKPTMPNFVTAIFYDHNTGEKAFQEYVNGTGGYMYGVVPGHYDILLYSIGTTYTHVDSLTRMDQAYAYTNPIESGYSYKYEPDHLLVGAIYDQKVPALIESDTTFVIHGQMETMVDTWKLIVHKIKGLQYASSISIMIDGLADTKKLTSSQLSNNEMKMYFSGVVNADYSLIETPFCIFGKLPDTTSELNLSLALTDESGESYKMTTDVTAQFNDPENTQHIINVDFDIELKQKTGGGFQPTVDDWTVVVENFDL